jgi:hypothetical protein
MEHYLFNFSEGDREQAAALLRVKMWGIGRDEKHRDALAPADLVLIYLAPPKQEFIGQAELASALHDWTSAEAEVYPGDSPCGVLLSRVEEWDPPVALNTVVPRIDSEASNPHVQQNAKAGFQTGVIRITPHEYETVLAIRRRARPRLPESRQPPCRVCASSRCPVVVAGRYRTTGSGASDTELDADHARAGATRRGPVADTGP